LSQILAENQGQVFSDPEYPDFLAELPSMAFGVRHPDWNDGLVASPASCYLSGTSVTF